MDEWNRAVDLVRRWAAHNGLRTSIESDTTMDREFDPTFLNVTSDPYPDVNGIRMARPTIATLMKRYFVSRDGVRLHEFIEVRLVRHGRMPGITTISPDELERFGLEARHLDRID